MTSSLPVIRRAAADVIAIGTAMVSKARVGSRDGLPGYMERFRELVGAGAPI